MSIPNLTTALNEKCSAQEGIGQSSLEQLLLTKESKEKEPLTLAHISTRHVGKSLLGCEGHYLMVWM